MMMYVVDDSLGNIGRGNLPPSEHPPAGGDDSPLMSRRSRTSELGDGRRVARAILAILLLVGVGIPIRSEAAHAVTLRGDVFPVISCTASGITWSGSVTGFLRNTNITYHWVIRRNGRELDRRSHGGYHTNDRGTHWRLPSGFPQALDCGPGHYTIEMWVTGGSGWAASSTPKNYGSVLCR